MCTLRFPLAALLATGFLWTAASPATAVLRSLDFEASVDEDSFFSFGGPAIPELLGEVATVQVRFEDSGLVNGTGEISPPALSVDLTFLGRSYTEEDDDNFPSFPSLEVEDDEPVVMDLILKGLDFGDPRIEEIQVGFSGRDSSGELRTSINILTVPEPSSLLLGYASLATVAAIVRRRRMRR